MRKLLSAIGCAAIVTLPLDRTTVAPSTTRTTLAQGARVDRSLSASETHVYQIQLAERDYLAASVMPAGIDVAVSLAGPDGREILNSDVVISTVVAEHAFAVAAVGGSYELRVKAANSEAPKGSYVVTVDAVRPATPADSLKADAMRKLEAGIRLMRQPDRDSRQRGLQSLEQSREAFRKAGDSVGESWAAADVAWVEDMLVSPHAVTSAREAVALCRAGGDRDWLSFALFVHAMVHQPVAEVEEARKDLEESLSLAQERRDVMAEVRTRNGMGIFFGRTGDAERAAEQLKIALELALRLHWREQQQAVLNNLGIATKELGDYKKALAYYGQTLALARELNDPGQEANALNNIGNLYRQIHEYQKALSAHHAALELARRVGNREHEGRALNTLGWTYFQLGEYARALTHFEESLAIRRQLADSGGLASTLDGAGMTQHKLGDDIKAFTYMDEALRLRKDIGERYAEVESLAHIAEVHRDRGELDDALRNVEAAVHLSDALRGRVMNPDLRASFAASESDRYDVYVDVLMQLARSRSADAFITRAFEASDHGRARVLLESLLEAHADIREGIDATLLEEERADLRKLDDASARLSRLIVRQADEKSLESARADIEHANADYQQVEGRIRMNNPKYTALMQPNAVTIAEIQRRVLDNASVLLEFDIGAKRSWLWAVTTSSVHAFELPPRARIEKDGRHLYSLLTARQPRKEETRSARASRVEAADAEWRGDSATFSRMILGAAARTLGPRWRGKRLIVAGDGVLHYVPFSSLPDPMSPAAALVQGHEIVNVPSASVLAAMREQSDRAQRPAKAIAIVADPVFEADDPRVKTVIRPASTGAVDGDRTARYSRLPFSRQEAMAIASLVEPTTTLRATDFDANRALVTSGELQDYRIVHFATHGFLNSETPRLSGLLLSLVGRDGRPQDGFLRLNDVYNLHLPADLVVLSACQTALGKEIRGEGLVGLTRGFMYAGARRVVASLWEVDDSATAELMKWFYRGILKEGLTPAAALRAAQRRVSQQPQWSAPFYWSGFVLQGEWR